MIVALNKYAALVEYDGTPFLGYQSQVGGRTVQDELESALAKLTGTQRRIQAASRTDTGVHAEGQVVSFRVGESFGVTSIVKGLNYYLPDEIAVCGTCPVDDGFDVRRMAIARSYRYRIVNRESRAPLKERFALRIGKPLDVGRMREACRLLQGTHDFRAFATSLDEPGVTIRDVAEARVSQTGDVVEFWLTANAFLRHQVRNTVGQLVRVGLGKCSVEEFADLIDSDCQGVAGPAASPRGLSLVEVKYASALPFATWSTVDVGRMSDENV